MQGLMHKCLIKHLCISPRYDKFQKVFSGLKTIIIRKINVFIGRTRSLCFSWTDDCFDVFVTENFELQALFLPTRYVFF